MKSTWSPLYRGLLPAAACGPPGKKKFGKPVVCTPRNVVGPSAQWSSSARPSRPRIPMRRKRAGAEVEAGRPHDDVELPHAVGRLDPALGHAHDRRLLEIDERDVRVVVRPRSSRSRTAAASRRSGGPSGSASRAVSGSSTMLRIFSAMNSHHSAFAADRTAGRCSCW